MTSATRQRRRNLSARLWRRAARHAVAERRRRSPILIAALVIAAFVVGFLALQMVGRDRWARRSENSTTTGRPGPATAGSLPISEKSIVVLPFENRSRDPDNAYFADGIQDEILTRLAKIADLKVISHTSTQEPDNFQLMGDLALTNMGLGDKTAAFSFVEKGMTVVPIKKDATVRSATNPDSCAGGGADGRTRSRHRCFTETTLDPRPGCAG